MHLCVCCVRSVVCVRVSLCVCVSLCMFRCACLRVARAQTRTCYVYLCACVTANLSPTRLLVLVLTNPYPSLIIVFTLVVCFNPLNIVHAASFETVFIFLVVT